MVKILYVEDEPYLGKIVSESLFKSGYDVCWETEGSNIGLIVERFEPDICILDIMLPDVDGYTLCNLIRNARPLLPIIFLTAKSETADIVKGFEAGGTDYIRKPFSIDELVARINNQIRLTSGMITKSLVMNEIPLGLFRLRPERFELEGPDGTVRLSNRMMQVLKLLSENINGVTDRKHLLNEVWGDDSFFNSRNLDVYINKLRELFRSDKSISIQTLKSRGYLFLIGD